MAAMPGRLHGHYPDLARRSRGRRHSDIGGSWGLRRAAARRRAFLSKISAGCMPQHAQGLSGRGASRPAPCLLHGPQQRDIIAIIIIIISIPRSDNGTQSQVRCAGSSDDCVWRAAAGRARGPIAGAVLAERSARIAATGRGTRVLVPG